MQFNFINDTTATAFIDLGIGTYDVTYGTLGFNGTLSGTDSAVNLATITPGGTQAVTFNSAFNAKLLLSLGQALTSANPSPSNPSLSDYNTLWDKVELFLT